MVSKKSRKKDFNGMSYRDVQKVNSKKRSKLPKEHQQWLRNNAYKNIGWDNIINLYKKIDEILNELRFEDMSLEDLFLEADRIGNKYQTLEERKEFEQLISKEVSEISDLIDEQFPDAEIEILDFSQKVIRPH